MYSLSIIDSAMKLNIEIPSSHGNYILMGQKRMINNELNAKKENNKSA